MNERIDAVFSGDPRWLEYLERLPPDRIDVYLRPEYAASFEACYDDTGELFVWMDAMHTIVVPLLRRPLPKPVSERLPGYADLVTAYGYAGPIASAEELPIATWSAFRTAFAEYCRSTSVLTEFQRLHPLLASPAAFAGISGLVRRWDTVWIDLKDPDPIAQFRRGHRDSIRRASARGVAVRPADSRDDLAAFHALYTRTMTLHSADARYFVPLQFFEVTKGALGDRCELILAEVDGVAVAGALLLSSGPWLHYHFAAAERDERSRGAATLIIADAAVRGRANGHRVMHLGGGGPEGSGLLAFKSGFSDRRSPFYTHERVHDPLAYGRVCNPNEMVPCYRANTDIL